MADIADWLLDQMFDPEYHDEWDSYADGPDIYGRGPSGEGPCPLCGRETQLRNGRFGAFYGCPSYPNCIGSRNYP